MYGSAPVFYCFIRLFIATEAASKPATDGTNDMLPGICLPFSEKIGALCFIGASSEYTTGRCNIPLLLSSLRMTLANGHPAVFEMSDIFSAEGSSLFPVPMELIIGIPRAVQRTAISIFALTVSIASITKSYDEKSNVSAFSGNRNSCLDVTVALGLISRMRSATTSTLGFPIVLVSAQR